jgi:hypothetical protein
VCVCVCVCITSRSLQYILVDIPTPDYLNLLLSLSSYHVMNRGEEGGDQMIVPSLTAFISEETASSVYSI